MEREREREFTFGTDKFPQATQFINYLIEINN